MLKIVVVLHNIFVVYLDSLTRKLKEQHLFEMDIFCNIINVFTVTFDKFIVFLQNKSINLFLSSSDPKLLNSSVYTAITLLYINEQ